MNDDFVAFYNPSYPDA